MSRPVWSLALAVLVGGCRAERTVVERLPSEAPPIILISIDTLRSDHLPAYGYSAVETPALERLRRDGIVFEDVWSQSPLTLPSHASIFTGLLPPAHGVRNNIGYRLDAAAHPSLARVLKGRGYATGGAVSSWVLRGATGIGDSFDFFDDAIERPPDSQAASQVQRSGTETASRALAWAAPVRGRPFFLFVHLYEPHAPYQPPEPYRSRYALAYDGEIAAADAVVGELLGRLDEWGLYDRAVVIVLSDHGEGLMEHGEQEHGILLYREALQVPLIVKLPGSSRRGERVAGPASLADVFPTVAALAGATPAGGGEGRDLLRASATPSPAYSETFYPRIHLGWSELRSLADGRYHYIDGPEPELYDLGEDAGETKNLYPGRVDPARELKRGLNAIPEAFQAPAAADAEEVRKLTALGYLSASSPAAASRSLPSPMRRLPVLEEVRRAFRLASEGDRRGAIAAFRTLLAANPDLFDARYKLALTLEEDGQLREAAEAFREAIRSSPSMATDAALPLARVSFALGDLDAAKAHAELALEDAPADAGEILARVAIARGALAEAQTLAAGVRGTPVLDARGAVLRADIHLRRNQPQEALTILDAALAKLDAPARARIADAQYLRGDSLARLNRPAEAEAAFREEIRGFPKNADAYSRLAVLYAVEHRRVQEVRALLEAMHAANPGAETAELAAKTLESLGDAREAAAWRLRAARIR